MYYKNAKAKTKQHTVVEIYKEINILYLILKILILWNFYASLAMESLISTAYESSNLKILKTF